MAYKRKGKNDAEADKVSRTKNREEGKEDEDQEEEEQEGAIGNRGKEERGEGDGGFQTVGLLGAR